MVIHHLIGTKFMLINLKHHYIKTVIHRVLPNMSYQFKEILFLYQNRAIKNYFKNFRKIQEYPNLYDIFKRSGFDMSLADKVRLTVESSKIIFKKNLLEYYKSTVAISKNLKMCRITPNKINFLSNLFLKQVLRTDILNKSVFIKPTIMDLLNAVNKTASMGLPYPSIKKREILNHLNLHLEKFYQGNLKPSELFRYPSAVFVRSQIRSSDLKIRLVHAVEAFQQILENFYYQYFVSALPLDSCICLGRTQSQIGEIVKAYDNMYCYSFDYKSWDNTRQQVLSVISFELLRSALPLSEYEDKILVNLRNLFLTLPIFHPLIPLSKRSVGTVSGSGFTTLDNSLCNWVLTNLLLYEYSSIKGVDISTLSYQLHILGDDVIVGTTQPLDIAILTNIAKRDYGATLKLECEPAMPGTSKCNFLGSSWENGVPFRPEKLLVASVLFGSGNFPYMTTNELFQSRFIEIFGNSGDCTQYWKRLNRPLLRRLFFFNELSAPFRFNTKASKRFHEISLNRVNTKVDSRGFWFNANYNIDTLSDLWRSR